MPAKFVTHLCQAAHSRDPERPRPAADGRNLCYGCITGMTRNLTVLPSLYEEVEASMPTTRRSGGAPVSGTREPGLPVNLPAGELASQITYDLFTFATWVASDRGLHAPTDRRVPALCSWLGPHVDWLAASTYAGDVRDILTELVGRAYAVIDPQRRPVQLPARCINLIDNAPCGGGLFATVRREDDPAPSVIYCDTCEWCIDSTQWYRFGRQYRAKAAEIARDQHKCERIAS